MLIRIFFKLMGRKYRNLVGALEVFLFGSGELGKGDTIGFTVEDEHYLIERNE